MRTGVLCERLGYDAVWGNDHITTQHYVRLMYTEPPNFYDVLITMAMIAQATTRLRVGAGVLVMPMREPVMLAKQVATIDQLSGGRFMPAVGIGADTESGPNRVSSFLIEKATDYSQQLHRAVGLGDVVIAPSSLAFSSSPFIANELTAMMEIAVPLRDIAGASMTYET